MLERVLKIRNQELRFGERTFVMGIVNVSPDSFSGDGISDPKAAIDLALKQLKDGADLVDVGGQSTRPGHTQISETLEMERVVPVVAGIRERSDAIISIDTFRPAVFLKARSAGADILNSIWGLTEELERALRPHPCPLILMHNKEIAEYKNGVVGEVRAYLIEQGKRALNLGLSHNEVVLDPGIGFGKTADHNLDLLANLKELTSLGFPTLLGTSRKSTIGKLLGKDVHDRIWGTASTTALAVAAGLDIVRVHDIAETIDVVRVADAIVRKWRPANWSEVN
jgi:dihydropteroate synthase